MASVIYLDSSDDEHEPVIPPKRGEQQTPSNVQQLNSGKPIGVQCKLERTTEDPIAQRDFVEHGSVPSPRINSTVFNDQVQESVGIQLDRREKLAPVLKRTSAMDVVGSFGADENSLSRHFWQAGDYEGQVVTKKRPLAGAMEHVRVHPKFLHSNATSHKWALGAIAELLDNAIDEVSNGATYVRLDQIKNSRDGSPALLVQDNGGGMSPDNIRQCMSLGYSLKNQKTTIGQYGNGFKTSTMRLGADVIVFTRNRNLNTGKSTQSIGLLSYTFLRKTGHEDTVVPMLDYELDAHLVKPSVLLRTTMDDWLSNLNTIIKWSPYSSEAQLLSQFNDIGWHGTKVIIYNLWLNDDGILELDFDSDDHDIQLRVASKELPKNSTLPSVLSKEHISNRYQHSLRAYASILYLKLPEHFKIILRGQPVEHLDIAEDLKFKEYIVYRPQIGSSKEASVTTTIGFSKEAPLINVHGFCVYHRNRLIMPFWKVFQENSSRGRGVIGVLEANFIEPAHDKQDFERTSVFLRLEGRLKAMTIEYWNLHSHLIGYKKIIRVKQNQPQPIDTSRPNTTSSVPLVTTTEPSPTSSCSSGQPRASGPSTPPRAGVETIDADGIPQPSGNGAAAPIITSVERIAVDNSLPEKVKVEEGVQNSNSKRSCHQELSLVEASKRQRLSSVAVPLSSRGAGDIIESTPDNGALSALEEQNSSLRQRCAEYELRERHWKQKLSMLEQREKEWEVKVSALEREVEEERIKCVRLMSQMKSLSAIEAQASKKNVVLAEATGVIKSERSSLR